jgi:hypothetical protein
MVTVFAHRQGMTGEVTSIERGWLGPTAGVFLRACLLTASASPSGGRRWL